MIDLAACITKAVKEANPTTDVAIMTSGPEAHCIEARDWDALLATIGHGGNKINRIHLPYEEMTGKGYIYYLNSCSMAVRAMAGDDVHVLPEVEHSAASVYRRSPRFMRFVLDAAIPLVLSGMTYSLYDFVANGTRDSFGYGQTVKAQQPFMQGVRDLGLRFSSMAGVVVPIDPRSCYYQEMDGKRLESLYPYEYKAAAHLSALGISFRYSRQKAFCGQTVFFTTTSIPTFTDEELRACK